MQDSFNNAPLGRWPLYRSVAAALLGYVILFACGVGIMSHIISLLSSGGFAFVVLVVLALTGELLVVWWLLGRKHIPHSLAIALLVNFTLFVAMNVVSRLPIDSLVFFISGGVLFVGSAMFYDWLFNGMQGKLTFASRVLRVMIVLLLITTASFLMNFIYFR